jgi:hypothetical protein
LTVTVAGQPLQKPGPEDDEDEDDDATPLPATRLRTGSLKQSSLGTDALHRASPPKNSVTWYSRPEGEGAAEEDDEDEEDEDEEDEELLLEEEPAGSLVMESHREPRAQGSL